MTAVQWWCSGVMLDTLFNQRPRNPPSPTPDPPLPTVLAAENTTDQNPTGASDTATGVNLNALA